VRDISNSFPTPNSGALAMGSTACSLVVTMSKDLRDVYHNEKFVRGKNMSLQRLEAKNLARAEKVALGKSQFQPLVLSSHLSQHSDMFT
jgi:hypothetical protein